MIICSEWIKGVSISSELITCGGGVCSILLLPLVARCMETIDVCTWRMFVVYRTLLKYVCVRQCFPK